MVKNKLYYGDNLDVLRRYIQDESVDLVYLDPPFKSDQDYNVLFAEQDGSRAAAQIKAFGDMWQWDEASARAYQEVVEAGGQVSQVLQSFRGFLGDNDMLAYLAMMAPRLVELRRALKPTGSLYLHCDPTASHYLKLLLDAIFGLTNFRNEIIWSYRRWPSKSRNFQTMHDVILFYTKGKQNTFHVDYEPPSESFLKRFKGKTQVLDPDTKSRKLVVDRPTKGMPQRDVWNLSILAGSSKERLGYPTQKPEALLERIIKASSNEGDIVLDPFCGCGTAIAAAQKLHRSWTGIDITHLAIGLIKHRLRDTFGEDITQSYEVIGEPVSLPDVEVLGKDDPFQFQWWALGLVGARPVEQKKGADQGIDGRLYFHDDAAGAKTKQIIFSVKAGRTSVPHVRDLRGVIERENAEIGVLLSLQEPTKPMRTEAMGAGFYESPWGTRHPRIQLLTVTDLLLGKGVNRPTQHGNVTFKKAPKHKRETGQQRRLFKK